MRMGFLLFINVFLKKMSKSGRKCVCVFLINRESDGKKEILYNMIRMCVQL